MTDKKLPKCKFKKILDNCCYFCKDRYNKNDVCSQVDPCDYCYWDRLNERECFVKK